MNKPSLRESRLQVAGGALLLTLVILAVGAWYGSEAASPPEPDRTLVGWFNIVWGDAPDGRTQTLYTLTLPDGETITLTLTDPAIAPMETLLAWRGRYLHVKGTWVESSQEAQDFVVSQVDAGVDAQAAAPSVAGAQPWISIMCKFKDVAAEPKAPGYFQNMYSSTYPGLDHYWREQSYNQINVVGSGATAQWYTLPQPRSYYVYDSNGDGSPDFNFGRASNDCTALANPYVYFPGYVGINMMFNADLDGYAWGGGWYFTLDGVTRAWNTTWEPEWAYSNVTVMAHEMGHGFGLPHSSGMYGRTYDNRWDVMSDTWTDCGNLSDAVYGCLGQHTNTYHKNLAGWIGPRRYVVPTGSVATLTLEQLAQPQTADYLMAQIPINGSSSRYYTVEARRKVGYDLKLPGQGVIIHQVDTSRSIPSQIVDVDGNGNTGDAGALWTVGETFVDAANHISVAVNSATTTGFVITVANAVAPVTPTPTTALQPTLTPTPTTTPQPTVTPTPPSSGAKTKSFQNNVAPSTTYTGNVDTHLSEAQTTTNFGTAAQIIVSGSDPAGTGKDKWALLRWDLSSISGWVQPAPPPALTLNVGDHTSGQTYELYEALASWSETAVTWSVKPARGTAVLGIVAPTKTGTLVVSLNADGIAVIQKWLNTPTKNFGFYLLDGANSDTLKFGSSEKTTYSLRPKLTVTYKPPLITKAPWTENVTATGASVLWETDIYGKGTLNYRNKGVTTWTAKTVATTLVNGTWQAKAVLAGLSKSTTYEYRVRASADSAWTSVATFTTAAGVAAGGAGAEPAPLLPKPPAGFGLAVGRVEALPGTVVTLPVALTPGSGEVTEIAFSLDYDPAWLTFDATDGDEDGLPDSVSLNLPGDFAAAVAYDPSNTGGELTFSVSDLDAALLAGWVQPIVWVAFTVAGTSGPGTAAVQFAAEPAAGVVDAWGRRVPVAAEGGSVFIRTGQRVYLPLMRQ